MSARRRVSPPIGKGEVSWVALGGVLLAVAMTWPLVLHLGSDIGKDLGDPLLETWQVAWIGNALLHQPLHLWESNTFWPLRDTLAFSDALVGYAPVALVAQASPGAALAVYDLLFVFAYALAFVGSYFLARELGLAPGPSVVAGAAFAYAPWKLAQNGHLHVLSSGGIPLVLFLLLRGYRRERWPLVVAGWLVAAWQMTLGFTLGLQLAYLLAVLSVVAAALLLRGRVRHPSRAVVVGTVAGVIVFALAATGMARPYLRVVDAHPEARKTVATVASFSPSPRSFLAAPTESWLWADATSRARAGLAAPEEEALFPGLVIGLLALIGLVAPIFPGRLRIGLAAAVLACAVLSLGVRDVHGPGRYLTPYRFLFDFAPGWDGVRTPGRINVLTSLGLALLAGAGAAAVVARSRGRWSTGLVGLVLALVLAEGLGPLTHPRVPPPPAVLETAPQPQLQLPAGFRVDSRYAYWSTLGFPEIVNGAGGFDPDSYDRLRKDVAGFPDARSVEALRTLGVRSVVLHPQLAAGTPWEHAATRPVQGLGVDRRVVDGVVLFRLR